MTQGDSGDLGVAIIGYGYWGPNLARSAGQVDGMTVKAIVDPRPHAQQLARSQFPGVLTFGDLEELFDSVQTDVALIATPADTHFELAARCLRESCHVLVEKPLTTDLGSAEMLVRLATEVNRQLMVDHTFLFSPAVRKMKQLLEDAPIGDLVYFDSVRTNLGIFQPDVSVLWDLAVHDLSILMHLVELKPRSISATAGRHPKAKNDAAVFLTIEFQGSFFAHINVSWLSPMKVRRLVLSGSSQTILYDDMNSDERIRVYAASVEQHGLKESDLLEYRLGDILIPRITWKEPLRVELEHFRDVITSGEPLISSGESALPIIRVLEYAQRSLDQSGRAVEIPG